MTTIRSGRALGFLTVILGILTLGAAAAPLDRDLQQLDRLEARRDRLLARGDSLGRLLASVPAGDRATAARLLQEAEGLGERSREVDLEILLTRDRCRSLAIQELATNRGPDPAAASRRADALRSLLQGRLNQPPQGEFVLVEPDSSDGYETLLDKQAYLKDLRDRIVTLDRLSGERAERLAREQALLGASQGFVEESRFLDEGGRVGSSDLLLRQPGDPPQDDPGHARAAGSVVGTGREEATLNPAPSESTTIGTDVGVLSSARVRLKLDLARVDSLLAQTKGLLDHYAPSAP